MDVLLAATGLLLASPLVAIAAAAIRVNMGTPIMYCQLRPGLRGKPFVLLKLRTMSQTVGGDDDPEMDAERLTVLGRLLRRCSIDELPQLWNVMRGDMSLVGPRPLRMRYIPRYSEFQARRHEVKPGITGWAQVNGRNAMTWNERFAMDVWYVDHRSLWLDIKIVAMTSVKVLKGDGISHSRHATMGEFVGSQGE